MSANPSIVAPSPWITETVRLGVQSSASRAQLVLTTLGTTASSGYAPATWAASSAWAVLPSPGSSASRKVRCPSATAESTLAWWAISSRPGGSIVGRGSGSSMHAGAPGTGCSNALSTGPISSQPVSRPLGFGFTALKSGTRNGLASWADRTDCGIVVRRSGRTPPSAVAAGSASGSGSRPPACCISRLSARVASPISASSCSSPNSDGCRAASRARLVATPSSRLRRLSRWASVSDVVGQDPGALLAGEQGDGLEPRVVPGGHLAAVDRVPDLPDGSRQDRHQALFVPLPGRGSPGPPVAAGPVVTLRGQPTLASSCGCRRPAEPHLVQRLPTDLPADCGPPASPPSGTVVPERSSGPAELALRWRGRGPGTRRARAGAGASVRRRCALDAPPAHESAASVRPGLRAASRRSTGSVAAGTSA